MRKDERGLVGLAVVANLIVLAIVGVVLFDLGSVMFARLQVQDVAETSATEGARAFKERGSREAVEAAVRAEIEKRDTSIVLDSFSILASGSVTVEVRKRPGTILLHRLSFLRGFVRAFGAATRAPPRGL